MCMNRSEGAKIDGPPQKNCLDPLLVMTINYCDNMMQFL